MKVAWFVRHGQSAWDAAALVWWLILGIAGPLDLAGWLLVGAPLCFVPLAWRLLPPARLAWERRVGWPADTLLRPAAALFSVSFLVARPWPALLLATPWGLWTLLALVLGELRFVGRRDLCWADRSAGVGQGMLVVASAAVGLYFLGLRPLQFPLGIILLTGVHFHYAAFLLPVLGAEATRQATSRSMSRVATVCLTVIVIAIPLAGLGIAWFPLLEWVGVLLLAGSAAGLGVVQLMGALTYHGSSGLRHRVARGLLLVSGLSLLLALGLAVCYGYGEFRMRPTIDIRTMIHTHGLLNALGFCGCGLLAWTLLREQKPPDPQPAQHYPVL